MVSGSSFADETVESVNSRITAKEPKQSYNQVLGFTKKNFDPQKMEKFCTKMNQINEFHCVLFPFLEGLV